MRQQLIAKATKLLTVLGMALGLSMSANSTLIAIDYNDEGGDPQTGTGLTQTGFTGNGSGSNPLVNTDNGITSTLYINSITSGRDRGAVTGSGTFTYGDLFRDLTTNLRDTTGTISTTPNLDTLTFSGLSANTAYTIQIWALDKGYNDGGYTWIWDTTAGTGASAVYLGGILNSTSPSPTSNDDFSYTTTRTSNGSGELNFGFVVDLGSGHINGFELSAAIPEPSTLCLLVLSGAGLFLFRRFGRTPA